jgi:hypothetical protein
MAGILRETQRPRPLGGSISTTEYFFGMVQTNSDSAKREKEAVTFAIRVFTIYGNDREAVKFQDSGTEINISNKHCNTSTFLILPERSVCES